MKIIATSNFDLESVSEYVVASGIQSKQMAITMAKALNDKFGGEDATYWYVVKEDDYVPYKYDPNG